VAEPALKDFSLFNSRKAIPFAVAMLTLLSIVELGRGVLLLLLIPYAALGIMLVVLYLMCLFAAKTNGKCLSEAQHCLRSLHKAFGSCMRRIREECTGLRRR
jgi:hypothetical protein